MVVPEPDYAWPRFMAKFLTNEVRSILNKHRVEIKDSGLTPEIVALIAGGVFDGEITRATARQVLDGIVSRKRV